MKRQVLGAVMLAVAVLAMGHLAAQSPNAAVGSDVSGTWAVSAEGYELSMNLHQDVIWTTYHRSHVLSCVLTHAWSMLVDLVVPMRH